MVLHVGLISAGLGFLVPAILLLSFAFRAYRSAGRSRAALAGWQAAGGPDVQAYDRRWMDFQDASSEISVACRAVALVRPPEGKLQLIKNYLAFGERHYLGGLVKSLNDRYLAEADPHSFAADFAGRGAAKQRFAI
jgi:hypothetical protein